MARSKRILEFFIGLVLFLTGAAFFFSSAEASISIMLFFIQLGMTVRGFSALFYYLSMARYMVGGKWVLYRSFILLDLGVLAGSLVGYGIVYAAIYLAVLHGFSGIVDVLRANESRANGGSWRIKTASGVTNILMAIALVLGVMVFKQPLITIYIYGAGLMYAAVLRIANAFRRTNIVYVQ